MSYTTDELVRGAETVGTALAAVGADKGCAMAHLAGLALRLIGGSKVAAHVQPALAAAATAFAVVRAHSRRNLCFVCC